MDPDLVLCTLDDNARLRMELTVDHGKGYVPAGANRPEETQIGLIPIDSVFSPVRKVAYKVDNARVGQVTDYDKLSLDVTTNGTISPEDAVALAARILLVKLEDIEIGCGIAGSLLALLQIFQIQKGRIAIFFL